MRNMLTCIAVLYLGTVFSNAALSACHEPDSPPRQWGRPGLRDCMRQTANRWHSSGALMPAEDISTHGSPVPAFPGAEGFGANAFGGRGGKLYRVTNLNDSGPGSLRHAVTAEGPRIVIFDVSGTIRLQSRITITQPYLTIAGQTAPGDGITVAGHKFDVQTYDVIIRHMRFRRGVYEDDVDEWTFRVRSSNHVIVDHVSISWGVDGNLGVTYSDNVTIQNSIIAKPLWDSIHPKGVRGYGALVRGRCGARYSILRNLWANHRARVPRPGNYVSRDRDPDGLLMDFRNNVIYQGIGANYDLHSVTKYNVVNNYCLTDWHLREHSPFARGHLSGNYRAGEPVRDQWLIIRPGDQVTRAIHEQAEPFEAGTVTTLQAEKAWDYVIGQAGAQPRDEHDTNVIREVINAHLRLLDGQQDRYTLPAGWTAGPINSQDDVGGLPELTTETVPQWIDTNRNGIPDWWEQANGLDSTDPNIANTDSNGNGYTNIEDYLNDLDAIRRTHKKLKMPPAAAMINTSRIFAEFPHRESLKCPVNHSRFIHLSSDGTQQPHHPRSQTAIQVSFPFCL